MSKASNLAVADVTALEHLKQNAVPRDLQEEFREQQKAAKRCMNQASRDSNLEYERDPILGN